MRPSSLASSASFAGEPLEPFKNGFSRQARQAREDPECVFPPWRTPRSLRESLWSRSTTDPHAKPAKFAKIPNTFFFLGELRALCGRPLWSRSRTDPHTKLGKLTSQLQNSFGSLGRNLRGGWDSRPWRMSEQPPPPVCPVIAGEERQTDGEERRGVESAQGEREPADGAE